MPNSFTDTFYYLQKLMLDYSSIFEVMGLRIYTAFVLIIIVWTGLQIALSGYFDMAKFVTMIFRISIGFAMIQFYSVPIPGIGLSFVHLIVDQGKWMANQLEASMVTKIMANLKDLSANLPSPGMGVFIDAGQLFRWVIITLLIAIATWAVYFFSVYGFYATAVFVLLGPVAVPFWIIPEMKWIFDGWIRGLIQYSMYAVFANAYLFVFGNLLMNFVDRAGTDLKDGSLAAIFGPLVFYLAAMVGAAMTTGSLCNHFFSGRSGESGMSWRFF